LTLPTRWATGQNRSFQRTRLEKLVKIGWLRWSGGLANLAEKA
jgi:hypothetical protein